MNVSTTTTTTTTTTDQKLCFACHEQSVKHPQTFFLKKNDYRRVKNISE